MRDLLNCVVIKNTIWPWECLFGWGEEIITDISFLRRSSFPGDLILEGNLLREQMDIVQVVKQVPSNKQSRLSRPEIIRPL